MNLPVISDGLPHINRPLDNTVLSAYMAEGIIPTSDGRVFKYGVEMKQTIISGNRPAVHIGRSPVTVARIIAECFLSKESDHTLVRHLDGDPRNNNLSNLAWGTAKDNSEDARLHGTQPIGEKHGKAKMTVEAVLEIRRLAGGPLSHEAIAAKFGISRACVQQIIYRKTWTHV